MGISSPGIGSGLQVDSIVSKLMSVESAPLATYDKKTASFQSKVTALGTLSGALGGFQTSLSSLSSLANFQSVAANSGDTSVLVGSASTKAVAGIYNINVTQLAQAQTLASSGLTSSTAAIGLGGSTTLSFQLGTVSGGSFGLAGGALGAGVLTGGISNGALTINGTAIATGSDTRSAKALADAINAKNGTTGVSATAATTITSASTFGGAGSPSFGNIDTTGGGSYTLSVGGVQVAVQGVGVPAGAGVTAASLDAVLAGSNGVTDALAAAGIGHTGSAANGDLQFTNADGDNISIVEGVSGSVQGGIGKDALTTNTGSITTVTSTISLASTDASPITVGGTNPALAGLTAGIGGAYLGASFAQDGNQASGSVVIDSSNNSLQGIRDAINKGNFGVTATIVSDGSSTPNHLVLSSTKSGASSSIKLSLSGVGGGAPDAALDALLSYDPAGTQNLKQNTAAQSTVLNVNGIPVSSNTNSVTGAIQGVTLTIGKVGRTNLVVSEDTNAVKSGVNAFVKAYNDLNKAIKDVSGYDPDTKTGGPLLGDKTVQNLQAAVRKQLTTAVSGLEGKLTTLSSIGVSFDKTGALTLDSGKLQKAIDSNFEDIGALFAAVGKATDNQVSFKSSTAATKPGDYALNITTLASQGSLTSASALGASTVIAADTSWNVTIDDPTPSLSDHTATIAIKAGSYTPAELATLVQSAINGASGLSSQGLSVSASIDGSGKLVVASSRYGAESNLAISNVTGSLVADVFGAAASVAGVDVAGTLGGLPATGSGQTLTGAVGSPAEGLKIDITGGATGDRGTVGFSQGYAYQLNNLATTYLGPKGFIAGQADGLGASIKDVAKRKDDFASRLTGIEARYRAQFTALDTAISSLNATSTFLTQQFAAMSKQTA